MTERPPPTPDAVSRIHALGEKAILQFFEEIPGDSLRELAGFLPPVDGFRTDSSAGIQQRKRALAKKLASKGSLPTPHADPAYRALYVLWRAWASEHIGEGDAIDALLDKIEEAEGALGDGSNGDAPVNTEIEAAFGTLRSWSQENKCTREQIERLFTFSPFSATEAIQRMIQSAKVSSDVDRDAAYAGLPQRLQNDEAEIQALKSQVASLALEANAATSDVAEIKRIIASLQTSLLALTDAHQEARATLEKHAGELTSVKSALRERDDSLLRDIGEAKDAIARLTARALRQDALDNVTTALGRVEKTLVSDSQHYESTLTKIAVDICDLSEQIAALSKRSDPADTITALEGRLAALEKDQTQLPLQQPSVSPPPREGAQADHAAASATVRLSATRLSTGSDHPARTFDSAKALRDAISTELQALGLKKSAAQIFATEIAAAALAGQIVFFKGGFAADTARACARAVAGPNSFRVSIPIGLNDGEELRAAFNSSAHGLSASVPAFAIEGINRSALEVFGDVLDDLSSGAGSPPMLFFASIVQGDAALTIDPNYLEHGPLFDLDHLDWRTRKTATASTAGASLPSAVHKQVREQFDAKTVDFDEPLRQLRAFAPKRKPRIERTFAVAYAALSILHDERDAPTPLQSLTYGWLAPLWVTLGLPREDADTEIDGGKCDGTRADPRIASMLTFDFCSGPPSEHP
jgi:hypothetical protein